MSEKYNKLNPFLASIKERYLLSKAGSGKNTQHIVLDICGSDLTYEVGDSLGIVPLNHPYVVNQMLAATQLTGHELIRHKQSNEDLTIEAFFIKKANLATISPKLFREIYQRQVNKEKQEILGMLLLETQRESLKNYLNQREVWDFLTENHEVHFTAQEIADLCMPLLPRFYSIASSQRHVGEEVHLTVELLEYETNGHLRYGVCTHYLSQLVEVGDPSIPVFIQSSHNFRLPQDHHTDMIMIGPGTGVAPFRAFLQERIHHHQARGKHWLFFGGRQREYDFLYEGDWNDLGARGHLSLELAFSRDQEHKIYVQHRMHEKGREFYDWLEKGAFLYVCGDAQYMAKDVDLALHKIVEEHGAKSEQEAREYIKNLRQQKRYLRDVY